MGAKTHFELEAWQLADEVRQGFFSVTSKPKVRTDFDFCSDTNRAARSACRNLTEGFYRHRHREFAHFVNVAQASLGELLDAAHEARMRKYIDDDEYRALTSQTERARRAALSLYRYLSRSETPGED